ncbi:hypothetical protein [Corynebacterium macginleyi]|uniref:DUF4352 domain-containing protein n=1 Tax=Corynebacterium macginleyi TaxID=38290 RepID=A0A3M0GZ15_9CORY|nr:hypothetical protein [Corynebacterium macginleyi]MBK4150820.1 hypothetical protein [Corynebacterium macginleyi]MBK4168479.1 hypothetical protein [Corynebacterium macginleyi]QRP20498.1 hypothetical protein I6J25_07115 [Corynebacterium macginleyi]RMB59330.1 hypothetical protein D9543_07070 [Corynebacterium macginleyi]RMB64848.1 hypothetical protein D9V82_10070 [Corynebacterium macginleyi]
MKKLLPILAIPLALTACSNDAEPDNTPSTEAKASETTSAAPTESAEEEREIGEELQLGSNASDDVTFKVTDITLGEECKYGTHNYADQPYDLEGAQYLQITAEVDAKKVASDGGKDSVQLEDPEFSDEDGYTQPALPAVDCRDADDGHETWTTTINNGEKKRIYGAYEVPQGLKQITIDRYTFNLEGK